MPAASTSSRLSRHRIRPRSSASTKRDQSGLGHDAEEAAGIGPEPAGAHHAHADVAGVDARLARGRDGEEWLGYVELRLSAGLSA